MLDMLASLSVSFKFLWAKSHQDDDTTAHLLPCTMPMNVHTNSLATDCLNSCADPSKIAPLIAASQASLNINGKTINRQFAQHLQQAANSPQTCKND
jgi:hypothetical protein